MLLKNKINSYFISIVLSVILLSSGLVYSIPNAEAAARINVITGGDGNFEIEGATPYYDSMLNDVQYRIDNGIPAPEIRLKHSEHSFTDEGQLKITSTLILRYTDPSQISPSHSEWGRIIVEDLPDNDSDDIIAGDYTDQIVAAHPEVFDSTQYGVIEWGEHHEEVVYVEEITYDIPRNVVMFGADQMAMSDVETNTNPFETLDHNTEMQMDPDANLPTITTENVLMGFTLDPTPIGWIIDVKKNACIPWTSICAEVFEAKGGYHFEYALGLRLPASVTLYTPTEISFPDEETFGATLIPLDFTAEQYEEMGVTPFDGHELVAQIEFFMGFWVEIFDVKVLDPSVDVNIDLVESCDCGDIVTPIGYDDSGQEREFPLGTIDFPPDETGLKFEYNHASLGVGLRIDPLFSSSQITADWDMTGEGQGNGELVFTDSDLTTNNVGPITVLAPPLNTDDDRTFDPSSELEMMGEEIGDYAELSPYTELQTDNYKFHFDQMILKLQGKFVPGGWLWFFPDTGYFDIVEINFADFFGGGLVLGQHDGTEGASARITIGEPDLQSASMEGVGTMAMGDDQFGEPNRQSTSMEGVDMMTMSGDQFGTESSTIDPLLIVEMAEAVMVDQSQESSQNAGTVSEDTVNRILDGHATIGSPRLSENLIAISQYMSDNPSAQTSRQGTEKLLETMLNMPEGTPLDVLEKMAKKIKKLEDKGKSDVDVKQLMKKLEKGMKSADEIKKVHDKDVKEMTLNRVSQQSIGNDGTVPFVPIRSLFEPPLRLLEMGFTNEQVICNPGLVKVLKISTETSICVTDSTAMKLIERGVAYSEDN